MLKLINKGGMIQEVTEEVYAMWGKDKNGFTIIEEGGKSKPVIPDQITEFQAKKAELNTVPPPVAGADPIKPEVHSEPNKTDAAAEMDIMREALKAKGVKFHHMIGYDKLKKLYDDNKE